MKPFLPLIVILGWIPVFAAGQTTASPSTPEQAAPRPTVTFPSDEAGKLFPGGEPVPRAESSPSLLPDPIPRTKSDPVLPKIPGLKKSGSTFRPPVTAAELDLRIRYRKARNIAESDAKVREAWEDSRAAATDYEKRQALKRYYNALFGRMVAIDRGIAPIVEQYRQPKTAALDQLQVAPLAPPR